MRSSNGLTPRMRQVKAAISAGLLLTMASATWAYPAAFLPQIEREDSDIQMSKEQISWFASVTLMMFIPGSVIGGTFYEWFSPRKTMLTLTPALGLSSAVMALTSLKIVQDYGIPQSILLGSRVLQGLIVAYLNSFIYIYTYEICDQHTRSFMTGLLKTWTLFGYLLSYISGPFFHWHTIAWLLPCVTLLPSFIALYTSPESPLWLARKGKEQEAKEVLMKVRCSEKEAIEELEAILISMDKDKKDASLSRQVQKLMKKPNVMAVFTTCAARILDRTTGSLVITIYIVHIFKYAGIGLEPKWSSIIVGSSRIFCSLIASLILCRTSRRFMLILGNTITGISCLLLGMFFYLKGIGYDVSWLHWLPLAMLTVLMVGYTTAVGPTTSLISVELLPGCVRPIGHGINNASYSIVVFALSKYFIIMQDQIGMHGIFFLFACGSFIYALFTIFHIPETYRKSVQDIQNHWENY